MAAAWMAGLTSGSSGATSTRLADTVRPHGSRKPHPRRGEGITGNLFVYVYGLGVLSQVVQAREPSRAVALEWTFTSVFSNMARKMLAPGETQRARRKVRTEESLAFLFLRGWRWTIGIVRIVIGMVFVRL